MGWKESLDLSDHELIDDDAAIVVEEVDEGVEVEGGGEGLNDAEREHERHVSTGVLWAFCDPRVGAWEGRRREGGKAEESGQ